MELQGFVDEDWAGSCTQDLFSCWVEQWYHGNQERKVSGRIQHWGWICNPCKSKQWRHLSAEFPDRIIWKLLLSYLVLLVGSIWLAASTAHHNISKHIDYRFPHCDQRESEVHTYTTTILHQCTEIKLNSYVINLWTEIHFLNIKVACIFVKPKCFFDTTIQLQ